ncbi:ExbD/TolR family protein [Puniceicoccus vermicola]|uniref:Biopolymer transporter ExbD n=1 Tax=Puniceicoccus vermicola TaxID=388746 RepID=A0A7X1E5R3_9BACT|nr:biopolymer transporter ExbD [Puniceicoccus vermicola]MBC2601867.1 biopolymer transporter ExbD [Puniceicoccus vermicola]
MSTRRPGLLLTTGNSSRVATIRRFRAKRRTDENIEVDLSPLIDCVFLLLIFFLVTTMLKKLEKQIPVELPDYTSALASVAESEVVIYAMDAEGNILKAKGSGVGRDRGIEYEPLESFPADLKRVAEEQGTNIAIRLDTDREVPVQRVIDALDTLSLQGFEKVGVRLRHRGVEDFAMEGYR